MKKALKVIGGSILAIIAIALMITGGAETIIEDVVELFFDLLDIVGEHKEKVEERKEKVEEYKENKSYD